MGGTLKRLVHLPATVSPDLYRRIERYRKDRDVRRTVAVRELLTLALDRVDAAPGISTTDISTDEKERAA